MELGLTIADLRAGLTAIGELPIKAKEAANAVAIMDRYRAAIALLQAPPAPAAPSAPQAEQEPPKPTPTP